jgi:hypothetical protein
VEQLAICARPNLIDHGGLKIHEDNTRDVLAGPVSEKKVSYASSQTPITCPTASGRPAGCHAPGSTGPSSRSRYPRGPAPHRSIQPDALLKSEVFDQLTSKMIF